MRLARPRLTRLPTRNSLHTLHYQKNMFPEIRRAPTRTTGTLVYKATNFLSIERTSWTHGVECASREASICQDLRNCVSSCGRPSAASGSSCISPTNHDPNAFLAHHAHVTFVGRPFSLVDAPEHFARLRRWGLTFGTRASKSFNAEPPLNLPSSVPRHMGGYRACRAVRMRRKYIIRCIFNVCFQRGARDEEYLHYLQELLTMMTDFGIVCIVSMHQDVWSRFSGGSGAPAWTLEAVGFDLDKLEVTGAAYLGGIRVPGTEHVKGRWPTGYLKLASCTMWFVLGARLVVCVFRAIYDVQDMLLGR